MRVGIGIPTRNRPDELQTLLDSIKQFVFNDVAFVFVYDDASDPEYIDRYYGLKRKYPWVDFEFGGVNRGVAYAKNVLLSGLISAGCDWLFLIEDDCEIISENAIKGYINACEQSGVQHLNYHIRVPWEVVKFERDGITGWSQLNGVFSIFSRESIVIGGLFDEHFYNMWEHIEHTQRLALNGFTTPFKEGCPDATGSDEWVRNNYVESIGPSKWDKDALKPEYAKMLREAQDDWRERRPSTFHMIWD